MNSAEVDFNKMDGLVPVIAQDPEKKYGKKVELQDTHKK